MVQLSDERFEELVVAGLDSLPEFFASKLENVDITIEAWPTREQTQHLGRGGTLLGLYEGVPLTQRGPAYSWVMPDKITIFRGPILNICRNEEDVAEQVRHTVIHEIAHHFGISDDRLRELDAY